jgi:hypothetical protein
MAEQKLDQASVDKVMSVARRFMRAMILGAGRGSRLHMETVSTLAKQKAPVKIGNLKGSGRAEGPISEGGEFAGSVSGVGFGAGVSATYAVPVHQRFLPFLAQAEAETRSKAMPLVTKEVIKEMQKVKP